MVNTAESTIGKQLTYSTSSNELTFEWYRNNPAKRVMFGLICITFLGLCIRFSVLALVVSNGNLDVSIEALFSALISLLLGYMAAAQTFNKIRIQCDKQQFVTRTGPLPFWPKARSIATRDIKQLYADEDDYSQSRNVSSTIGDQGYQMVVHAHTNIQAFKVRYLPSREAAQHVEEKIGSFLNIKNSTADSAVSNLGASPAHQLIPSQIEIPESITVERTADSVRLSHFKKRNLIFFPIVLPLAVLPFLFIFFSIYHGLNGRSSVALLLLVFAVVSTPLIFMALYGLVNKTIFTISAQEITVQKWPLRLRRKGKTYNRTDIKQITIPHKVRGGGRYAQDFHDLTATTYSGETIRLAKLEVGYKDAPFIKREIDIFFRLNQ